MFLNFQKLAQMWEEGLNALTNRYNFNIKSQTNNYAYQPKQGKIYHPNSPIISGTLVASGGSVLPIPDYDNYDIMANLSLICPEPFANDIFNILSEYIQDNKGTAFQLDDYAAVINFDTPTAGNLAMRAGAGTSVEIQTLVYYQFIANGLISNSAVIQIDGEKIVYLEASLGNKSTLYPANVGNNEFSKATRTEQQIGIRFVMPYRNTAKTVEIVRDLLNGALDKTYTLTYYDGIAYTQDLPFTAKFCTQDINMSLIPQKIPSIEIIVQQALEV